MRREIPLFIIDRNRHHKGCECDFLVCTDKDNGFIARIDYVGGEIIEAGNNYRIGLANGGVSCKIQIVRMTGKRPAETAIRTLLKRAMSYYGEFAQTSINVDEPSREDCVNFLNLLINGNLSNLGNGNLQERQTTAMSLRMLECCKEYINGADNN